MAAAVSAANDIIHYTKYVCNGNIGVLHLYFDDSCGTAAHLSVVARTEPKLAAMHSHVVR